MAGCAVLGLHRGGVQRVQERAGAVAAAVSALGPGQVQMMPAPGDRDVEQPPFLRLLLRCLGAACRQAAVRHARHEDGVPLQAFRGVDRPDRDPDSRRRIQLLFSLAIQLRE